MTDQPQMMSCAYLRAMTERVKQHSIMDLHHLHSLSCAAILSENILNYTTAHILVYTVSETLLRGLTGDGISGEVESAAS